MALYHQPSRIRDGGGGGGGEVVVPYTISKMSFCKMLARFAKPLYILVYIRDLYF